MDEYRFKDMEPQLWSMFMMAALGSGNYKGAIGDAAKVADECMTQFITRFPVKKEDSNG